MGVSLIRINKPTKSGRLNENRKQQLRKLNANWLYKDRKSTFYSNQPAHNSLQQSLKSLHLIYKGSGLTRSNSTKLGWLNENRKW